MSRTSLVLRDCGGLRGFIENKANKFEFHRIEVEHALRLANLNQEEIQQVLKNGFEANISQLEDITYQLDKLYTTITDGLSNIDSGIYQLHLDNQGTQAYLNDILLCLIDKDEFKRELEARRRYAEERQHYYKANSEYCDAITLTQRALNEVNIGKSAAMLDEAMILFERASKNQNFKLQSHFQLGYLYQIHEGNLEEAAKHYSLSLGEPYSAHNIRVLRHLSHIDYLQNYYDKAFERMADVVKYMENIETLGSDLAEVYSLQLQWPGCMDALEQVLNKHDSLLKRNNKLSTVKALFLDGLKHKATENFMDNYPVIKGELQNIKPDLNVLFDGARYAARMGNDKLARELLEKEYNRLTSLNARRLMLIEGQTCGDF